MTPRRDDPSPPPPPEADLHALACTIDLAQVESAVLRRLIEEVRQEQATVRGYDRIHNRHNRGNGGPPRPYPPPPAPPAPPPPEPEEDTPY